MILSLVAAALLSPVVFIRNGARQAEPEHL